MTLLEMLAKWAGLSGPKLIQALEAAAAAAPDLAPAIEEWIIKLNAGLSPANIMAIASQVLAEAAQVGQGQFSGTQKPQDLA